MEPGRKSLHTPFRKYMHNPLDNEGLVQGIGEKKRIKDLYSYFLENLAGLQCPTTQNQRA